MLPLLLGFTLWDATPDHDARTVLLVTSPGVRTTAYLPLIGALRDDGRDVRVLSFGCGSHDSEALTAMVVEAAQTLPGELTVVAHGLGGTLVMSAAPRLAAERYVLLAPVLDLWPVASTMWLAEQTVPVAVDLSAPLDWQGQSVASLFLGDDAPLTCAPVPFLEEIQQWVRQGAIPLSLEEVDAPVWIAVSAGDDVATVEAVIPASRALADRRLVRVGMSRFDAEDFDHITMIADKRVVRRVVRATRRGR